MSKILTISAPYGGGKPTGYAVDIPNDGMDVLETEIARGLRKGWNIDRVTAAAAIIDEDLEALKEQGYTYIPGDGVRKSLCNITEGRFLVEITEKA